MKLYLYILSQILLKSMKLHVVIIGIFTTFLGSLTECKDIKDSVFTEGFEAYTTKQSLATNELGKPTKYYCTFL